MSNSKLVFLVGLLLILVTSVAASQDYTSRLDTVLAQIKTHVAEQKPEWRHRSIEPMKGSRNVSVNNWELDDQVLRVSIIAYGSAEQAAETMLRFSSETRTLDRLPDLGDGGYSWGIGGSNICFRKADVTIWISTTTTNLKEAVKTCQEFARLIDAAVQHLAVRERERYKFIAIQNDESIAARIEARRR